MNTFLKIGIFHTVMLPECIFMVITYHRYTIVKVTILQCCCTMLCAHCHTTLQFTVWQRCWYVVLTALQNHTILQSCNFHCVFAGTSYCSS